VREFLVEPEDVNALETPKVVELQRLGLPPGFVVAGAVERPRPEFQRVVGIVLLREVTESHMGYVRLLRPQVGEEDAGVERIV